MLPGFRFLFAAIVLSMSILVFGLGAAALLRAAHEEVASIPSRRAPPEPVFAQQRENSAPTLALLRVEPSVVDKAPDNVPPAAAAPAEPASEAMPAVEPEKLAAPKPESPAPPEPEEQEVATADPTPSAAAPPSADTPAPAGEIKIAATEPAPPPANEATSALSEPVAAVPAPEINIAATKIATLGGPAVTVDQPASTKTSSATPDRSAIRKRLRAQRAKERRRIGQRSRPARQAVSQQQSDPFSQPTITTRSR